MLTSAHFILDQTCSSNDPQFRNALTHGTISLSRVVTCLSSHRNFVTRSIYSFQRDHYPLLSPYSRLFHSVYLGLFEQHRATNRKSDGARPSEWSTRMYSVQEVTRLTSLKARGIFSAMLRFSNASGHTDSTAPSRFRRCTFMRTRWTQVSLTMKLSLSRNRLDSVTLAACAQRNARFTRAARIPFTHEGKLRKVKSSSRYVNKIRSAAIWYSFLAVLFSACAYACVSVCVCAHTTYIYIYIYIYIYKRYRFLCH